MDRKSLPKGSVKSYGNGRFVVLPDVEMSISGLLFARCSDEMDYASLNLYQECAARLKTALGQMIGSRRRRKATV